MRKNAFEGFPLASKAAYTEMLVWPGGYSSSASASAVRLEGDQFTGFLPRNMCPSVNILPNTCSIVRISAKGEWRGWEWAVEG